MERAVLIEILAKAIRFDEGFVTSVWVSRAKETLQAAKVFLMNTTDLQRMWINQPSEFQPHHKLHGTKVLAVKETDKVHHIYFLSGPIISQQIESSALSLGWLTEPID